MEYLVIVALGIAITAMWDNYNSKKDKEQAQKTQVAEDRLRQRLRKQGLGPKEVEARVMQNRQAQAEERKNKARLEQLSGSKCPKCSKVDFYLQPISLQQNGFFNEIVHSAVPYCVTCNVEFVPRVMIDPK